MIAIAWCAQSGFGQLMMVVMTGHMSLSPAPFFAPRTTTALVAWRGCGPLIARYVRAMEDIWWVHEDVRWDLANFVVCATLIYRFWAYDAKAREQHDRTFRVRHAVEGPKKGFPARKQL